MRTKVFFGVKEIPEYSRFLGKTVPHGWNPDQWSDLSPAPHMVMRQSGIGPYCSQYARYAA